MYAGLRKITLINSYQKKQLFSEYILDKSVQITGDNGAGKTSLLRLIPFFYGATGSQIVRRSNVNKTFVDWYLPNNNSYLIFDYTTARGQAAHVICYRNLNNKSGITYQFIKGEFDQSVIIKESLEGKPVAISSSKLTPEFDDAGLDYESRIYSVKDYREIIQNIASSNRDNKFLSYSLCSGRNDVKHIEKITAALIQGKFNMADTKALFLDILDQGNSTIDFGVDADKIEEWCDDYNGLIEFSAKKETFDQAISNNKRIHYLFQYLASALQIIRKEAEIIDQEKINVTNKKSDFEAKTDEQSEQLNTQIIEKTKSHTIVRDRVKELDTQIENEDDKLFTYEEKDFQEKLIDLKQLSEKKNKLNEQQIKYEDLSKIIGDVEQNYKQGMNELENKFIRHKTKLTEEKNVLNQIANNEIKLAADTRTKQLTTLSDKYSEDVKTVNQDIIDLTESLATKKQRRLTPDIDSSLLEQQQVLEQQKDHLFSQITEYRETQDSAEKHVRNLKTKRDELLERSERIRWQHNQAEQESEQIALRLDPEVGTLFSFLEKHKIGWQSSPLGRVLDEKLLMSTNLTPQINIQDSNAIFDLTIDTSELNDCTVSNESDVKEFDRLQKLIDDLEVEKPQLTKAIDKQILDIKAAEIAFSQAKTDFKNANDQFKKVKINIENKKIEIEQAKINLIEQLDLEIKSLEKSLKVNQTELIQQQQQYEEAKASIKNDDLEQRANIETTWKNSINAINETIKENEKSKKIEEDQLKQERDQRLAGKGISEDLYEKYEKNITRLNEEIIELQRLEPELQSYESWYRTYQKLQPQRRIEREEKERELEKVSQQLSELESKIAHLRTESYRVVKQFKEQIKQLDTKKIRINGAINKLIEFDLDDLNSQGIIGYKNDLTTLLNDIENNINEINQLTKQRRKDLSLVEKITQDLGDGELYRLWKKSSQDKASEDSVNSDSAKIDVLEDIMNDIIPQVTRVTIDKASNMGRMLVDFKDKLLSFDADIKKLGRNISEQVQKNNHFSIVDSIDINVESALSKLQGWQDIQIFSEIYARWNQDKSAFNELPPKEFYQALYILTAHINADKVKQTAELFDIKFEVTENKLFKVAKTDKDMEDLASNGTNLLIQSMLYLALLSKQRDSVSLAITYPTDEIGKLTAENQAILLNMMESHNFRVVAAQPDGNNQTANLFQTLYHITPEQNIFNKPKQSKLAQAKAAENNQGEQK